MCVFPAGRNRQRNKGAMQPSDFLDQSRESGDQQKESKLRHLARPEWIVLKVTTRLHSFQHVSFSQQLPRPFDTDRKYGALSTTDKHAHDHADKGLHTHPPDSSKTLNNFPCHLQLCHKSGPSFTDEPEKTSVLFPQNLCELEAAPCEVCFHQTTHSQVSLSLSSSARRSSIGLGKVMTQPDSHLAESAASMQKRDFVEHGPCPKWSWVPGVTGKSHW